MYEDAFEQDRPRGGRRALIAAWLLVAAALGGVFGYVFLMPADPAELAKYGQVRVPLNPSQTPAGDAGTATGTAATGSGTAATGTAGQGTTATTGTQTATTAGSGSETTGITGESLNTQAGGTATAGSGARDAGEPADTAGQAGTTTSATTAGETTGDAGTGTTGTSNGGSQDQVANLPEAPDADGSGPSGAGADGADGTMRGESAVTDGGPEPQWQQYARVLSPPEGVDRIAVVVRGLGLSSAATEAAIQRLPGEVSLSFSPYARRSVEWSLRARARGHEVLMDLPMEPRSYPANDPGPKALMTSIPTPRNLENLKWILGKGRELVGVVGQMGSAFVKNKRAVSPVLRHLKQRGLIYVDNGDVPGNAAVTAAQELTLPHAVNDRTLDDGQISRAAVRGRLVAAERQAKQAGLAVVMAHPYPVTIDVLQQWSRTVAQRGLALVPITNVVRSPDRTEAAQLR